MNRAKKGNFIRVLRTIAKAYIAASPDDREVWIESVNRMCDDLLHSDFLGLKGRTILAAIRGTRYGDTRVHHRSVVMAA